MALTVLNPNIVIWFWRNYKAFAVISVPGCYPSFSAALFREVPVVIRDSHPAEVRAPVADCIHTIMHEYSIGEILVHSFYANIKDALYPLIS